MAPKSPSIDRLTDGRIATHAARSQDQNPAQPTPSTQEVWRDWPEVKVKVMNLPMNISTWTLYRHYIHEGNISRIDIPNNKTTSRTGFITFDPPPKRSFWNTPQMPIAFGDELTAFVTPQVQPLPASRSFQQLNPFDKDKKILYPERISVNTEMITFGVLLNPDSVAALRTCPSIETPDNAHRVIFTLNLMRKEIWIHFSIELTAYSDLKKAWVTDTLKYKIKIKLDQISRLDTHYADEKRALTMVLDTPPKFFRKVKDVSRSHDDVRYWEERKIWPRQTDIIRNRTAQKQAEFRLCQDDPVIDLGKWLPTLQEMQSRLSYSLGRWTTYMVQWSASDDPKSLQASRDMISALVDHKVNVTRGQTKHRVSGELPPLDKWLDWSDEELRQSTSASELLANMASGDLSLDFKVRYQLEVCLSQNILHEINITKDFLTRLAQEDIIVATNILEQATNLKKRIFNPMEIFDLPQTDKGTSSRPIPSYCVYTRSANVTPTTIYFNTPTVETSNRVVRHFDQHADRFLRVRFSEEKNEGRINPQDDRCNDAIFTRVKRVLTNGIRVGGRRYEFLAFGNSQFREHGAYFFAPIGDLDSHTIREWMGNFKHITTIAKYSSRLGQCFSTTRAMNAFNPTIETAEDVVRNGYCFTDGVGKISEYLAKFIANEFKLPNPWESPPSAFQIRLGGCKGMLSVDPGVTGNSIVIRRSQEKFPTGHRRLEVVRISNYAAATLNRQLISILSTLGVPDDKFRMKMDNMLIDLEASMTNEKTAREMLQKNVDINQMTMTVVAMILDGFMEAKDPFMISLLQLWKAWSMKYLKEKAKILIEKGVFVLGVTDESGTLEGHYDAKQCNPELTSEEKLGSLPEIFLQISNVNKKGSYTVITGDCVLARNPSLHPGDVRVVKAVDVKALHHLKDVVVFPQTGDRDLANMCSGGDLDGDDYIVMWDKDMIPPEINHLPMSYESPEPVQNPSGVTIDDITSFFVQYMKNDRLGTIANAHLAWSDQCAEGANDWKCLELAQLHSKAVDYPKTGVPAKMNREHRPSKWPHFMEKDHLPETNRYRSHKVLGQLYDAVGSFDFTPKRELPFDERILGAYDPDETKVESAAVIKEQYDAEMRQTMVKHGIGTEFEVWSAFVLRHNQENKDYTFAEELGKLTTNLKEHYRMVIYKEIGGEKSEQLLPFAHAMYVLTARQVSAAIEKREAASDREAAEAIDMPFISFPWLLQAELGKIAKGTTDLSMGSNMLRARKNAALAKNFKKLGIGLEAEEGGPDAAANQAVSEPLENALARLEAAMGIQKAE